MSVSSEFIVHFMNANIRCINNIMIYRTMTKFFFCKLPSKLFEVDIYLLSVKNKYMFIIYSEQV